LGGGVVLVGLGLGCGRGAGGIVTGDEIDEGGWMVVGKFGGDVADVVDGDPALDAPLECGGD
jgi:hypothetical protein